MLQNDENTDPFPSEIFAPVLETVSLIKMIQFFSKKSYQEIIGLKEINKWTRPWIYDIPVIEIFNKLKFIDQGITSILFEYEVILENSQQNTLKTPVAWLELWINLKVSTINFPQYRLTFHASKNCNVYRIKSLDIYKRSTLYQKFKKRIKKELHMKNYPKMKIQ